MSKRGVRQLALAALPMVVMSQCAPQCAPAPSDPPPPTMTAPTLPPVVPPPPTTQMPAPWTSTTRDITPTIAGQYQFGVDGMSRDGARIDVDLINGTGRLDVASGHLEALALRGALTDDGAAIIGLTSDPNPELRRHEIVDTSGTRDVTYPSLPAGWQISAERFGVAIDDAGRHVGVVAVNPLLGRVGFFTLDTATGSWTQPVAAIATESIGTSSWGEAFSADGSTVAVAYHNGPAGDAGYDELWHIGPNGVSQLINHGASGGPARTGYTWLLDMSPDGRYVLFGSTSTDLAGVGGYSYGALFVRDVVAGSTSMVRYDVIPTVGAISDDGRVVAFAGGSDGGYPTIAIRTGDIWPTVRPEPLDPQSDEVSSGLALNGRGTRLAYTNRYGRVLLVDFAGTGR